MMHHSPVDREDQVELFRKMASGGARERILLIRAVSGAGKSRLLEVLSAHCPEGVICATVDFKNGNVGGLADFLDRLCRQLGRHQFATLAASIARLLGLPNVQTDHNIVLGGSSINTAVTVNAADEDTRKARRVELTNAFFDDLERSKTRAVLIFDTYNDCDDIVLSHWLCGAFLSRAAKIGNVSIVISGQRVPDPTLEWKSVCHEMDLPPISAEHWHHYAQQIGLSITPESVEHVANVLKGNSLQIASYLESCNDRHGGGAWK